MHNLLGWIGGRIGALAFSAFLFGVFTLIYGATPGEAVAEFLQHIPAWASG